MQNINVVIFAGGKFPENLQDLSCACNFHDNTHTSNYFLNKAIRIIFFSGGGHFQEENDFAKNAKITPTWKSPHLQ